MKDFECKNERCNIKIIILCPKRTSSSFSIDKECLQMEIMNLTPDGCHRLTKTQTRDVEKEIFVLIIKIEKSTFSDVFFQINENSCFKN